MKAFRDLFPKSNSTSASVALADTHAFSHLQPLRSTSQNSSVTPPLLEGAFARPTSEIAGLEYSQENRNGFRRSSSYYHAPPSPPSIQVAPTIRIYPPDNQDVPERPKHLQSIHEHHLESAEDVVPPQALLDSAKHHVNLVSKISPSPPRRQEVEPRLSQSGTKPAESSRDLRPPVNRELTIKSADITGWQEEYAHAGAAQPESAAALDRQTNSKNGGGWNKEVASVVRDATAAQSSAHSGGLAIHPGNSPWP